MNLNANEDDIAAIGTVDPRRTSNGSILSTAATVLDAAGTMSLPGQGTGLMMDSHIPHMICKYHFSFYLFFHYLFPPDWLGSLSLWL